MNVLWFSPVPSCFGKTLVGSWVSSLERIITKYIPEIKLGIVFEYTTSQWKIEKNKVVYYPITFKRITSPKEKYEQQKPLFLKIINDFSPDIIQCFGTERFHYGLIVNEIKIPVVVHMMGFMNIYNFMEDEVLHPMDYWKYFNYNPIKFFLHYRSLNVRKENNELEKKIMKDNHYFMGRTEWDKNIVKYYSENAKYFHCPEAIRDEIYSASVKWHFKKNKKIRLITIGNAGSVKGNGIMLQTAWLLKNTFHVDFEWLYTSDTYKMSFFERVVGIACNAVNIKLIGRLDATQIVEYLSEADFYIHPSIIDNSPNSLCEAQLIGIPVIAANVGGVPQMVTDGITGFLYPYNEPYALAFKIMNLYNQEDILVKVSAEEYTMAHIRHAPSTIAKKIKEIYVNILEDKTFHH